VQAKTGGPLFPFFPKVAAAIREVAGGDIHQSIQGNPLQGLFAADGTGGGRCLSIPPRGAVRAGSVLAAGGGGGGKGIRPGKSPVGDEDGVRSGNRRRGRQYRVLKVLSGGDVCN